MFAPACLWIRSQRRIPRWKKQHARITPGWRWSLLSFIFGAQLCILSRLPCELSINGCTPNHQRVLITDRSSANGTVWLSHWRSWSVYHYRLRQPPLTRSKMSLYQPQTFTPRSTHQLCYDVICSLLVSPNLSTASAFISGTLYSPGYHFQAGNI